MRAIKEERYTFKQIIFLRNDEKKINKDIVEEMNGLFKENEI